MYKNSNSQLLKWSKWHFLKALKQCTTEYRIFGRIFGQNQPNIRYRIFGRFYRYADNGKWRKTAIFQRFLLIFWSKFWLKFFSKFLFSFLPYFVAPNISYNSKLCSLIAIYLIGNQFLISRGKNQVSFGCFSRQLSAEYSVSANTTFGCIGRSLVNLEFVGFVGGL